MNPSLITVLVALAVFAWIGWRAGREGTGTRDDYLTARSSQRGLILGLSFFASGLGAWILFTPPEVGTFGGLGGILGYALAAAGPFVLLSWFGPAVRNRLPEGVTLSGFVRMRFGRLMQVYVGLVSVFYMFIFVTAELTAVGGAVELLGGVKPIVTVLAVAVATAAYTSYGGLRASLRTDSWQAWAVLGLVGAALVAVAATVPTPVLQASKAGAFQITRVGVESLVVLVIAVTAANLFHQGYWQRTWAAVDVAELKRGAWIGAVLTVPVVAVLGFLGAVAAGVGQVETPSLALFGLLDGLPTVLVVGMVLLAVALVASSVDTLQNAMVALVADEVGAGRLSLGAARWLTALLFLPSVVIAVQGLSVLRLFLIADLLAAATVAPVLLGLWRRVTESAALIGALGGLAAVVVLGWVRTGSLAGGLGLLTLPATEAGGLDLGAFLTAPVAALVLTSIVSLLERPAAVGMDNLSSEATRGGSRGR